MRHAVGQIQRIVGALKSYSHLDQQATRTEADLHEGLETTLALLHHALRDIVVERRYGTLPRVPVYVDELNQVWTNLIQNAQQALGGKGTIAIETLVEGDTAIVRVIDDGPGVPPDVAAAHLRAVLHDQAQGRGHRASASASAARSSPSTAASCAASREPGRTVLRGPAADRSARLA